MLLSYALPPVHLRLIRILEAKQKVLSVAKKRVGASPSLGDETAEFPSMVVLNDKHCIFEVFAITEKCDERAPVFIHVVQALPLALPLVARQVPNEIRNLQVI